MFGKFFLTVFVILAALVWLRIQGQGGRGDRRPVPPAAPTKRPLYVALAIAGIISTAGALYWYQHWEYQNSVIDIQVIHPDSGHTTLYQARRNAIHGRRFVTLDGRAISLSASERMELRESAPGQP